MIVGIVGVALPLALASLARTGWPRPLLSFPVSDRFGWTDVAALLVLVGLPHAVGSDVWAKLLSARDAATARRAALGAAAAKLAFGAAVVVIALAGVALKPKTDSRGVPYASTPVPVVVEYQPYGDGLADVLGVTGRPPDTDTLDMLDAALRAPAAAPAAPAAVPPPAVA